MSLLIANSLSIKELRINKNLKYLNVSYAHVIRSIDQESKPPHKRKILKKKPSLTKLNPIIPCLVEELKSATWPIGSTMKIAWTRKANGISLDQIIFCTPVVILFKVSRHQTSCYTTFPAVQHLWWIGITKPSSLSALLYSKSAFICIVDLRLQSLTSEDCENFHA